MGSCASPWFPAAVEYFYAEIMLKIAGLGKFEKKLLTQTSLKTGIIHNSFVNTGM
jgi:hypothetical protein